ncbi:hypothetical protein I350_03302 [Cryptococcus amylolentus CBS 6273]|uniref:BTB domain-containing protein n=1 Tax=Cryptococcus amylolentus CBS 6273 TaxID=1296118 RepID=A0A1E3K3F7_9TREE|nr:hypothetical protein I350_03302 [Cryptococcus amylolentus CBS 6273]
MGDDETEIKVHPDWKDEFTNPNGDTELIATTVTLISSDEVHFHVPRYLLMASSPVLKNMLSLPAGNEPQNVELSDRFLENSSPIAFYLSLLAGENGKTTLENKHQGNIVKTSHAAILLAAKWESVLVLSGIEAALASFNIPSTLKGHKERRSYRRTILRSETDSPNPAIGGII